MAIPNYIVKTLKLSRVPFAKLKLDVIISPIIRIKHKAKTLCKFNKLLSVKMLLPKMIYMEDVRWQV